MADTKETPKVQGIIHTGPGKMEWMMTLFSPERTGRRRMKLAIETEELGSSTMSMRLSGMERDGSPKERENDWWEFRGIWFLPAGKWIHVKGRFSMRLHAGTFESDPAPRPAWMSTFGLTKPPPHSLVSGPSKLDILRSLFDDTADHPNTVTFGDSSGATVGPLHVYGAYPQDDKGNVWHCRTYSDAEEHALGLETSFCSQRRMGAAWPTSSVTERKDR